jgi:hypothetical protein
LSKLFRTLQLFIGNSTNRPRRCIGGESNGF